MSTHARSVLVVAHTGRSGAVAIADKVSARLLEAGVGVRLLAAEAAELQVAAAEVVDSDEQASRGCELVVVIGGDGTILRGAELARPSGTPLLGVNLGHVGFLAEAEQDDIDVTVDRLVSRSYSVEERQTLEVSVSCDGTTIASGWALNEASVEKAARERMLEVVVEVDGRPLSRWGGDGVVCATPTGSTAYAFSAGGPVVWPQVEALVLVPISAHALFARAMVVAPTSTVAVEVQPETAGDAVLWCDGRRTVELPPRARVEVGRGAQPVRLARLHSAPFADRLVAKFGLPVHGWRGKPH
ncbi:MAG TPA: NAD kinase [Nocardioidaceae bacterium]|nr:NAD kinase [Nocardioidaceae bacterium]